MSTDIAALLAQRFIQRKDVKALQVADGGYRPDRTPWKMGDLRAHVAGERTYGHYLCDQNSKVKLFVLDIDLEKNSTADTGFRGDWVEVPDLTLDKYHEPGGGTIFIADHVVHPANPRVDWRDRRHPGRAWWKYQLRTMADILTSKIYTELSIPSAAAYSGYKGIHVYGFTGEIDAADARALAMATLELAETVWSSTGKFYQSKGQNFYKYRDESGDAVDEAIFGFRNLEIEIYPKQDSMDGKDLGNLVRLPMGVNKKSATVTSSGEVKFDPAFFIDQCGAMNNITPHPNPAALLEEGNPFRRYEA